MFDDDMNSFLVMLNTRVLQRWRRRANTRLPGREGEAQGHQTARMCAAAGAQALVCEGGRLRHNHRKHRVNKKKKKQRKN
jgi:hypothetical protein